MIVPSLDDHDVKKGDPVWDGCGHRCSGWYLYLERRLEEDRVKVASEE